MLFVLLSNLQQILRRNIEHFSEKAHIRKIRNFRDEIMDFFFDFCKNMNTSLHILFLVNIYGVNNDHKFLDILKAENITKRGVTGIVPQ